MGKSHRLTKRSVTPSAPQSATWLIRHRKLFLLFSGERKRTGKDDVEGDEEEERGGDPEE